MVWWFFLTPQNHHDFVFILFYLEDLGAVLADSMASILQMACTQRGRGCRQFDVEPVVLVDLDGVGFQLFSFLRPHQFATHLLCASLPASSSPSTSLLASFLLTPPPPPPCDGNEWSRYGSSSAIVGALNLGWDMKLYPSNTTGTLESVMLGVGWGQYHFVLEGIAIFMCMRGSGFDAMKRTAVLALFSGCVLVVCGAGAVCGLLWSRVEQPAAGAWCEHDNMCTLQHQPLIHSLCDPPPTSRIFVGSLQTLAYLIQDKSKKGRDWAFMIAGLYQVVLFAFYLALWVLPYSALYRRPAVIGYAAFWTVYRPVYLINYALIFLEIDFGYCGYLVLTELMFGVALPIMVFITLRRDGNYWQGIITSTMADSATMRKAPSEADIRTPLIGTSFDSQTAVALAEGMDSLPCDVINWAHVSLEKSQNSGGHRSILGAGGTSRVFKGKYKNVPVAIKMLYCVTLTPETVANFFQESRLLSRLRHPNVVHMKGVCVTPPSICMVMELCKGSLYERLQLRSSKIDWGGRLSMALGCARAVACLHAQTPPILHMDIKSANFLVGTQQVPKWSVRDVQQWLVGCQLRVFSGSFYRLKIDGEAIMRHDGDSLRKALAARLTSHAQFPALVRAVAELNNGVDVNDLEGVIKITDLELSQCVEESSPSNPEGHEVPQTVNWTAPEVILKGKLKYTTAADCYSLGMVLWELLTGQVPFDEPGIGPSDVQALVTENNYRPPIPQSTPSEYADLLRQAWHHDASERPSAQAIADELLLMRRRWRVNRTLQSGRFLTSNDDLPATASEEAFIAARFAAASERTGPMEVTSEYNMGSLSNLTEDSSDTPVLTPAPRMGHRRTTSEGTALTDASVPIGQPLQR
jgi:serine/threonine protein kinase